MAEDVLVTTIDDPALDDVAPVGTYVPPPEERHPWERQAHEPARAYHAFCHFRDQKVHSCRLAYLAHKKDCDHDPVPDTNYAVTEAPKRWRIWSSEWGWVDRAARWDAEIDRQYREKATQSQLEARERHARLAQATLTTLTIPTRAVLEAIKDPEFIKRLTVHANIGPGGALQILSTIARMAQVIPQMVNVERLALGMTTESLEIDDKRESDVSFADRIAKDPVATDLAIQLLAQLASGQPDPNPTPPLIEGPITDVPPTDDPA